MKDIFVDNNIAVQFTNPMDDYFKEFIRWLIEFNNDCENDAYLVVSNKILSEYLRSCNGCFKENSIPMIIAKFTREGRLIKIANHDISEFKNQHYRKKIKNQLRSNYQDQDHLPIVLISNRKMALSNDTNLIYDIIHFPGYSSYASNRPELLNYK
jgi:hypothetical protein